MRLSSITDRLFGAPARRPNPLAQAQTPIERAEQKPAEPVIERSPNRTIPTSLPSRRADETLTIERTAATPPVREPVARPADRIATNPPAHQPEAGTVEPKAKPPAEDERPDVQYADVGDLKKSLARVRQAFRDAQKPD